MLPLTLSCYILAETHETSIFTRFWSYFGNLSWQGNGKRVAIFFLLRCTKQSERNNSFLNNRQTYVGQPMRLHSTTLHPMLCDSSHSTALSSAMLFVLYLLYSTPLCCDLLCSALLYSALLYSTPILYSALLCSALLDSTPLYSTPLPSILL